MTISFDKFCEAVLSSAYMFRSRGAYGSFDKALKALMKRKSTIGFSRNECERYFRIAVNVTEDSLEFEKNYVQGGLMKKSSSGWIDGETMKKIEAEMEKYLKSKNPDAPSLFIQRSIARINYLYHLS